jgi:glycosyltransferase involved in cell wall biosynthesis
VKRERVVHCAWSGGLGGTERQLEGILHHALEHGTFRHEALFLDGRGAVAEMLEARGLAHRLAFRRAWDVPQLVRFARLIRTLKPTVVHFHTRSLPAQVVARAALRRTVFVYTEHAPGALEGQRRVRLFYTLFGRRFHRMVAIAPAMRECLLRFGVSPSAVVDVSHGIEARAPRERPPHEGFVVGLVARLEPEKNIELFIDTIGAVRVRGIDCRGIIVGGGSSEAMLRSRIEGLGAAPWIELAGPQLDVLPYLDRMDLFFVTAPRETLGIAALEAMAAGVPVLAMPAEGGLSDLVRSGGVLLPTRSVNGAADAIAGLATHPKRLQTIAARGRRLVQGRTYAAVIERLEAAYLGEPPGQALRGRTLATEDGT